MRGDGRKTRESAKVTASGEAANRKLSASVAQLPVDFALQARTLTATHLCWVLTHESHDNNGNPPEMNKQGNKETVR